MKKILKNALYILLVVFTFSCTTAELKNSNNNEIKQKNRIKLVEETYINGYLYYIIEVDSVEFFANGRGGVYPLKK